MVDEYAHLGFITVGLRSPVCTLTQHTHTHSDTHGQTDRQTHTHTHTHTQNKYFPRLTLFQKSFDSKMYFKHKKRERREVRGQLTSILLTD